jgi:hypothetical protein
MSPRYVVGGAGLDVELQLPDLATDGYADIVLDIRFADETSLRDGSMTGAQRVKGPGELWGFINRDTARCWLPELSDDPAIRAWHVRQMVPIFSSILGRLVIHASAVALEMGVIGFVAPSGGGKSTLAHYLSERGHQFVADDLLAIRFTPEPAVPVEDALESLIALCFLGDRRGGRVIVEPVAAMVALQRLIHNGFGEHGDPPSWAFQFDAYHRIVDEAGPHFEVTVPDDLAALEGVEEALLGAIASRAG